MSNSLPPDPQPQTNIYFQGRANAGWTSIPMMHIMELLSSAKAILHRRKDITCEYVAPSWSAILPTRRLRKRVHRGAIAPDVEKTREQNELRSTFTILSSYSSCLRRSWCSHAAWKVLDWLEGAFAWNTDSNVEERLLHSGPKPGSADIWPCFLRCGRCPREEDLTAEWLKQRLDRHVAADLRQEVPNDISELVVANGGESPKRADHGMIQYMMKKKKMMTMMMETIKKKAWCVVNLKLKFVWDWIWNFLKLVLIFQFCGMDHCISVLRITGRISVKIRTNTGTWQHCFLRAFCFRFVWTQRERNHVLKDQDWYDFLILLLSRVQVQLLVDRLRQGHGWVVVNFGAVLVWRPIESQSLDLLAHQRQTKRMYSPPAQPVAWFSISCAKPSAQKFCAGQKSVTPG